MPKDTEPAGPSALAVEEPVANELKPQRRRRIGVMGGTFDPIHHGHLVAASEVMHKFDLDHVVFVPTATQQLKVGK